MSQLQILYLLTGSTCSEQTYFLSYCYCYFHLVVCQLHTLVTTGMLLKINWEEYENSHILTFQILDCTVELYKDFTWLSSKMPLFEAFQFSLSQCKCVIIQYCSVILKDKLLKLPFK